MGGRNAASISGQALPSAPFSTLKNRKGRSWLCMTLIINVLWWALQDSNLRLPPCEDGTLPLS